MVVFLSDEPSYCSLTMGSYQNHSYCIALFWRLQILEIDINSSIFPHPNGHRYTGILSTQ